MPALTTIADDELVVIDTNTLVYASQQLSEQCAQFLRRCAARELTGIVPMPVVAELTHVLMLAEARENGWLGSSSPARILAQKREFVRRLSVYRTQLTQFLGMGLRLESIVALDVHAALGIQRDYGLLTNDSLIVAVAQRLGCTALATADTAFARVSEMRVYAPTDLKDR